MHRRRTGPLFLRRLLTLLLIGLGLGALAWATAVRLSEPAGRSGELLGRGTGSSLEFQEYREYLPGDDIRHVDWANAANNCESCIAIKNRA